MRAFYIRLNLISIKTFWFVFYFSFISKLVSKNEMFCNQFLALKNESLSEEEKNILLLD